MVSPHEMWVTLAADVDKRAAILDFLNSPDFLDSSQTVREGARVMPPYKPGMACIAKVPFPSNFLSPWQPRLDGGRCRWRTGACGCGRRRRCCRRRSAGASASWTTATSSSSPPTTSASSPAAHPSCRSLYPVPPFPPVLMLTSFPLQALAVKTSLENVNWQEGCKEWNQASIAQLKRFLEHVKHMELLQNGLRLPLARLLPL